MPINLIMKTLKMNPIHYSGKRTQLFHAEMEDFRDGCTVFVKWESTSEIRKWKAERKGHKGRMKTVIESVHSKGDLWRPVGETDGGVAGRDVERVCGRDDALTFTLSSLLQMQPIEWGRDSHARVTVRWSCTSWRDCGGRTQLLHRSVLLEIQITC